VNWYSPSRAARFDSIKDVADLVRFLAEEKVDFVILSQTDTDAQGTPKALLREQVARNGITLKQEGTFVLCRLEDADLPYREIFDLKRAAHAPEDGHRLLLPVSETGVIATTQPQMMVTLSTQGAAQARYNVHMSCPLDSGYFVAQINWDVGPPYYRLVDCRAQSQLFSEVLPVPIGARQGQLIVTVRDTLTAQVDELKVEVY
jgi:hypothetical protein